MSKPIRNIKLAFPCTEDWSKMSNTEKGKFCETCKNQVIDFRSKTMEELKAEVAYSTSRICGRFNRSQLSSPFLKYAASALIASSLVISSPAQESNPDKSSELVDDDVIFGQFEVQPHPKIGWKLFYAKLYNELNVPQTLKDKTKIFVEFVVDTTGNMVDLKIVRSDDPQLNKEAIRALETLAETFVPGTQQGKAVRVRQVLPVVFDPNKD
jgi:protein TonB